MRMKKDKNHKMEAVEQFKFDFEKRLIQPCEIFADLAEVWIVATMFCFILILMFIVGHQTWWFTHA